MTVRDAVAVLKKANKIVLGWDGNAVPLNKDDFLQMDAYGKYVVSEIMACGEDCYELDIAMRPVKEGE